MKTDKVLKITLYTILGLSAVFGATLLLKPKKDDNEDNGGDNGEEELPEGEDEISKEQRQIPDGIKNIKENDAVAKGTKVFAKLDGIKGRTQPFVNNGLINNIVWEGENKGEYIGVVQSSKPDRGGMSNLDGETYTWFKVKLDPTPWKRYNNTKNVFTKQRVMNSQNNWAFFREDTLTTKK